MSSTSRASSSWLRRGSSVQFFAVVLAAAALLGIYYEAKDSIRPIARSNQVIVQEESLQLRSGQEEASKARPKDETNSDPSSAPAPVVTASPVPAFIPWDPQAKRRIVFVRVGQTGGTTIAHAFPRLTCRQSAQNAISPTKLQACFEKHTRDHSPLSSQLELELHMEYHSRPHDLSGYTTFLFSLRNPITRTLSAFSALHHNNTAKLFARKGHHLEDAFYKLCFPDLNHLLRAVEYLSRPELAVKNRGKEASEIPTEHSDYCQQLAFAVLKGKNPLVEKVNAHLHRNHRYFYEATLGKFPGKEVVAIRMEHLWGDVQALDKAMGGQGAIREDNQNTTRWKSEHQPTQLHLKELCCLLWEDLEIYQALVNHARNLDFPKKRETIKDVWNTCGVTARDQEQFNEPDDRTTIDNAHAKRRNQKIVVFSWEKWHKRSCAYVPLEHKKINLAAPPPPELIPPSA